MEPHNIDEDLDHKMEFERPRYSLAPYQFLMSQTCCGQTKLQHLRAALGVHPLWMGTSTRIITAIVTIIAEALGFVPLVGPFLKLFVDQCFLNPIRIAAIIEFAESCGIPESHFPVDTPHLDKIIKAFIQDATVDKTINSGPNMTDAERVAVEEVVKSMADILVPHNMLRYFGIGNRKPFRVKTPTCYACCYGCWYKCGFTYWYGASRTASKQVASFLQDKNVPYSTIKPVLAEWEGNWREYVRRFFAQVALNEPIHAEKATSSPQQVQPNIGAATVNPVVPVATMEWEDRA
jgi:hypothetical protein